MNHQLIKHQPHDGNGTTPRWVYRAENTIIKTIPYQPDPRSDITEQVKLINDVCGFEFIINYRLEDRTTQWSNKAGQISNTFLTYTMQKLNWLYNPFGKKLTNIDPVEKELTHIDGILKYVLPHYVDLALKIFPYANFDLSHENLMQRDNGDICFIDWDDCLLGNIHDSNDIGKSIIEECVKAHNTHMDDLDKQQVLENLKKTIDEYTKLTYNTKLCNFDIDIPNTVDYLYDRWIKILKSEGRL